MRAAAAILVAACALALAEPAAARDGDTLAACAAARTSQERHRLRCWRFDARERSSVREWDRAAPRHWERRRSWER